MNRPEAGRREHSGVPTCRSLWVQTVLYRHTSQQIWSFVRGLRAAARLAVTLGVCQSVYVALGDSSPRPAIDSDLEREIDETLRDHGVAGFQYVFFDENRGSANGQNSLFALRSDDTDYVFVTNPDAYLCPQIFRELLLPFADDAVGIVEARQVPLEHPKTFDPISGTTSWASGAGMLVRTAVLDEIKGFDGETFFLYCDDVDFSWRARLAGYQIVHQPTARIFHDKRLDPDGRMVTSEAEKYYAAEAALLMAWKYSRPDLVESWSEGLAASADSRHTRAVQAFRDREASGTLPKPIDPDARVAQFVGHYYGEHRFDVSV